MNSRLCTSLRAAGAGATLFALVHASAAFAAPQHTASAAQLGLPTATPESQGFSSAGLDALDKEMHALVDAKKLAGVTTLVSRHGKVVHLDTYGAANATTGDALKPDSIFRIASMTKPIAGVAMMQLYEQGKWKLEEPPGQEIGRRHGADEIADDDGADHESLGRFWRERGL
jgi:CubicO group peptidase (beta-lactamase class C family)